MNSDDLPLFDPAQRAISGEIAPKSAALREFGASAVDLDAPTTTRAISVSDFNRRVRGLLEARIELVWVAGEISNVLRAASGHWYFALKDAQAQVRCVMFRNRAQGLGFKPENGMQVEVRGLASLYEPRGEFQLGVESMRRAGLGVLFEAYERLKDKLAREGLFEAERKRALPTFPRAIAIVTSPQAAALRDVLATIARRAPFVKVILYPSSVQGAAAPAEICAAIALAASRVEVDHTDALLVCRGGGSIEDLWSFNDESVVRAIVDFQRRTERPVVSAIGHETDFTIADFVADCRAPTPTAGAELLTPDIAQLRLQLGSGTEALARSIRRTLELQQQRIDHAARGLLSPRQRLALEQQRMRSLARSLHVGMRAALDRAREQTTRSASRLEHAAPTQRLGLHRAQWLAAQQKLARAAQSSLTRAAAALAAKTQALAHLNPNHVLARGYAIVTGADGAIVRDATTLALDDAFKVRLAKGVVRARVTATDADSPET